MTPDPEEVKQWLNTLSGMDDPKMSAIGESLVAKLAAQEADFQARLAPWVEAVRKGCYCGGMKPKCAHDASMRCAYGVDCGLIPVDHYCEYDRLIKSAPDALRAQAREAEIRAQTITQDAGFLLALASASDGKKREALEFAADLLNAGAAAERAKAEGKK